MQAGYHVALTRQNQMLLCNLRLVINLQRQHARSTIARQPLLIASLISCAYKFIFKMYDVICTLLFFHNNYYIYYYVTTN